MTQKIRVLHVITSLVYGGIEIWLRALLRLQNPEVQFDFALVQDGPLVKECESLGAKIHFLPKKIVKFLQHQKALHEIISNGEYDVVHVHCVNFSGLILKIAQKCNVPVRIAHSHNTVFSSSENRLVQQLQSLQYRYFERKRVTKYATHLLACSHEAGLSYFDKDWLNRKPSNMVYCGVALQPYDVNFNKLDRDKLCQQFNIPNDSIVIGNIGRLTYQKNQSFLINVFAQLSRRNEKYVLFIIGEGQLRNKLESQIIKMNLKNKVILAGRQENIPEYMCQLFDVFCLPSRFEGFGIVNIEAIAAGLHSVCSSESLVTEIKENLSDRITSLKLNEPIEKWADFLEYGIKQRIAPKEGVKRIQQTSFCIENSARLLFELYNKHVSIKENK